MFWKWTEGFQQLFLISNDRNSFLGKLSIQFNSKALLSVQGGGKSDPTNNTKTTHATVIK